jgi:acylphosphatase
VAGTVTLRARIEGVVQGVWYRGWTVEQATALGLSGWVRNRLDGSVEALFSGRADAVTKMLDLCREGPPSARVRAVITEPAPPPSTPGFHQEPTG